MENGPVDGIKDVTRQEKRAEKLRKKRSKMKQHGKGLAQIYKDAVDKRAGKKPEITSRPANP
jgi:hypothetical protein